MKALSYVTLLTGLLLGNSNSYAQSLNCGLISAHGSAWKNVTFNGESPETSFNFKLGSECQFVGTVWSGSESLVVNIQTNDGLYFENGNLSLPIDIAFMKNGQFYRFACHAVQWPNEKLSLPIKKRLDPNCIRLNANDIPSYCPRFIPLGKN